MIGQVRLLLDTFDIGYKVCVEYKPNYFIEARGMTIKEAYDQFEKNMIFFKEKQSELFRLKIEIDSAKISKEKEIEKINEELKKITVIIGDEKND